MSNSRSTLGKQPRRQAIWRLGGGLCLLIPVLCGLLLACHTLSDLDIWLHLRVGQDVLSGEGFPQTNRYSFTNPDYPWINHEWGFQVLAALVHEFARDPNDVLPWNVLRFSLVLGLLLLLFGGELRSAGNPEPTGTPRVRFSPTRALYLFPPALVTLFLLWPRLILRPELLSYLFFILAVRWIDGCGAPANSASASAPAWRRFVSLNHAAGRTFWLTLVWVQCHGFFLLVPGLWLLKSVLPGRREGAAPLSAQGGKPSFSPPQPATRRICLMAMLFTLGAGLLSPNGLSGLLQPGKLLSSLLTGPVDLRHTISELAPLLSSGSALGSTILCFQLSLVWAGFWLLFTLGRTSSLRICVFVLAAAATLYSQRNLGFYAVTFYLIHSGCDLRRPLLLSRFDWWRHVRRLTGRTARFVILGGRMCLVFSLIGAGFWCHSVWTDAFYLREGVARRTGWGVTAAHYPFAAVAALQQLGSGRQPRVANSIDAASLIIARRAGLVAIDGRTEAYPASRWREYQTGSLDPQTALQWYHRHRVDAAVIRHNTPANRRLVRAMLVSDSWRLAAADAAGVLFLPVRNQVDQPLPAAAAILQNLADSLVAILSKAENSGRGNPVLLADRCLGLGSLLRLAELDGAAGQLYRHGLTLCPEHPLLNHNLGNLLLDQDRFAQAKEYFVAAYRVNGRLVEPRVNEGVCCFRLGDLAGAATAFTAALARDPERVGVWVNLAEVHRRHGDRQSALAAYDRALSLQPDDQRLQQHVSEYRSSR
ncbi:MAG: tetratricopeptide repeat protein [bacterium]